MSDLQLYESANDIFSLLPVKIYRHNLAGKSIHSPLHWHRSIEITIPLSGRIRFNSGSHNFDFGESDWIIINSCELHSCRQIASADHFTGVSIIFSLNFIEAWLGKDIFFFNPEDPILTLSIKNIALDIYNMNQNEEEYELELMSKVYSLISLIKKHCIKQEKTYHLSISNDPNLGMSFTDYIEGNYTKDISLQSAAEYFRYSPSYFSRLFKEALGVNFHSYLCQVRASHAASDLSKGKIGITDCAFKNGFPNTKSFITSFKKIYGCTPGAFVASLK